MRMELELFERGGQTRIGAFPGAVVRKHTQKVDKADRVDLDVSVYDPTLPLIDFGATELSVKLPGVADPIFQGPIWDLQGAGSTANMVRLICHDLESLFWDRYIEEDLTYSNVDQHTIAWNLIAHTQAQTGGDLHIDSGFTASGTDRTRVWYFDEHPNIYELLNSFRGVIGGFDWTIKPLAGNRREFQAFTPHRGSYKPNLVVEWGKNISDFNYQIDGRTINDTICLGEGEGPTRPEGRYSDTGDITARGLRSDIIKAADKTTELSTLNGRAESNVISNIRPIELLEVTLKPHPDLDFYDIEPGDIIPIRINRGFVQVASTYQIMAIEVNPLANTAKLKIEERTV